MVRAARRCRGCAARPCVWGAAAGGHLEEQFWAWDTGPGFRARLAATNAPCQPGPLALRSMQASLLHTPYLLGRLDKCRRRVGAQRAQQRVVHNRRSCFHDAHALSFRHRSLPLWLFPYCPGMLPRDPRSRLQPLLPSARPGRDHEPHKMGMRPGSNAGGAFWRGSRSREPMTTDHSAPVLVSPARCDREPAAIRSRDAKCL